MNDISKPREHLVIAIDPGACTGWAVGSTEPGRRLLACGIVYPDKGERVRGGPYDLLLIEKPVLTPVGPGAIVTRGNDLITCWGRGCRVVEAIPHRRYEEVAPGTWKGQVDKAIHNIRVLERLARAELELIQHTRNLDEAFELLQRRCFTIVCLKKFGFNHNEIDAVGLLLYALERWYR